MILKACTDVPDFRRYISELGGNSLISEDSASAGGASGGGVALSNHDEI
jgi:hypothetical protein